MVAAVTQVLPCSSSRYTHTRVRRLLFYLARTSPVGISAGLIALFTDAGLQGVTACTITGCTGSVRLTPAVITVSTAPKARSGVDS
jgi:hypothetical protein